MRPVIPGDFDLVYDIYTDKTVNPFMWHAPENKEDFKPVFADFLERQYFWIFQNNHGEDCAMASALLYDGRGSHIAEIQTLGIKAEYQGQGLGKRIMKQIINKLKKDGIERIQLYVEADNDRGISFYKSLGFQEEGCMKNFLKRGPGHYVDEIVMGMTELKEAA